MAFVNLADLCTNFAVICVDGDGVSIPSPIGSDGLASVSAICLGLWFQLNIASLHIDEEGLDVVSRDVSHTIGQIPLCNGDGKNWLLRPRRFRLYGLSESTMATSIGLATPLNSPSCTNHTPLSSRVKVEPSVQSITILSDDLDVSSPQEAMPEDVIYGIFLSLLLLMSPLLALVR
jgi:hypothetical protein